MAPSAFTGNSIGSLTNGDAAGTFTPGWPENRTRCSVPAWIFPASSERATTAAPMVSGLVPYSFVKRMRIREPPALRRNVCRIVWVAKPGVAGNGPCATLGGKGAAPQVATH